MPNTTGKKFGGRQKGTPNKSTAKVRGTLAAILSSEVEKIPMYLDGITDPERKLNLLVKLLPYIVPRLQSVEYMEVPAIAELLAMPSNERQARIAELKEQLRLSA